MLKYCIQKLLGLILNEPVFLKEKSVGYSLVRSERCDCVLSKHTRVYPPFFLRSVILGEYSYIARNSSITNCEIGRFCSIGPNFSCGLGLHPVNGISTSPMFYSTARQNGESLCKENKIEESIHSVIGNDVFIGANVTILDGVHVGDGVVIGAGAVVTKDIPPYAIAAGVPAKVIKYRFDSETIASLLERKWWNAEESVLERIEKEFWQVKDFLKMEH